MLLTRFKLNDVRREVLEEAGRDAHWPPAGKVYPHAQGIYLGQQRPIPRPLDGVMA
jgi:hypothetical protein